MRIIAPILLFPLASKKGRWAFFCEASKTMGDCFAPLWPHSSPGTRWRNYTDRQTDIATLWLNRPSGANSVKMSYCREMIKLLRYFLACSSYQNGACVYRTKILQNLYWRKTTIFFFTEKKYVINSNKYTEKFLPNATVWAFTVMPPSEPPVGS